jgi:hypothetical protein
MILQTWSRNYLPAARRPATNSAATVQVTAQRVNSHKHARPGANACAAKVIVSKLLCVSVPE